MDSGFLSYVVVADPDSSQLSDRSGGPAMKPRRDAGKQCFLQKAYLEGLHCRLFRGSVRGDRPVFCICDLYMAFQKGTQTAPHGGIMPPQAGISTAGNGNSGCAGRRLTVAGHGGIMNPLLLMYKTGQRWRAT